MKHKVGNVLCLSFWGLVFIVWFFTQASSESHTVTMRVGIVAPRVRQDITYMDGDGACIYEDKLCNDKVVLYDGSDTLCTILDERVYTLCDEHIGDKIDVSYKTYTLYKHKWTSSEIRIEPSWNDTCMNTYGVIQEQ